MAPDLDSELIMGDSLPSRAHTRAKRNFEVATVQAPSYRNLLFILASKRDLINQTVLEFQLHPV